VRMPAAFCPAGALVYLSALAAGLIMFLRPASVIAFQIKFYELINWRIQPISMPKEMRNTRIMGLLLILAPPAAIIYTLIPR